MASLLNVLVIGVALSLPVGLYLGLSQLQSFTRQLASDPQLSIFLALDADSARCRGDRTEAAQPIPTSGAIASSRGPRHWRS